MRGKIKYHRDEIKRLQKFHCTHPDERFIPDPSGNNDSDYECRICGNIR